MKGLKLALIIGGSIVAVVALVDLLNIPLEFPTQSNTANLAIGGGIILLSFIV